MFSRRHPYLFFILVFCSIISVTVTIIPILFMFFINDTDITQSIKADGEKVGIIEIIGTIVDAKPVLKDLKKLREDVSIKAIILRIDSPGGGVGPSQEIYKEIRKTIQVKRVIASMGSVAASGGYYVAAAADGIIANPGTITGSIGVIMGFTNIEDLLQKIGLSSIIVKSREFKDIGSPLRKMTDKEKKILQNFVNTIHMQFVKAIAEGRKMDISKVELIADGRIFSGEEAKEIGLIDQIGNMEDAINWAGQLSGIKGKIVPVYAREKKFSLWEYIMGKSPEDLLNNLIENRLFKYGYVP
ncbi:MAG: signal peptide peptidase SppA [Desulfobacterales bacterium]|nr:signal peptide peptidase SppA [Desulfobacterales bacterium]